MENKFFSKCMMSTKMVVILVVMGLLGLWSLAAVVAAIYMLNRFHVFGVPEGELNKD